MCNVCKSSNNTWGVFYEKARAGEFSKTLGWEND